MESSERCQRTRATDIKRVCLHHQMLTMPLKPVLGAEAQVRAEGKTSVAAPVTAKALSWSLSLPPNVRTVREPGNKATTLLLAVARATHLAGDFATVRRANLREASIRLGLEQRDHDLACRKLALKGLVRFTENRQDFLHQEKGLIHHHTFTLN